ncbi:MAG TPA: RtcB family protein [candidate division Zixibacteria bacterium]|nr:RtcB family protein [candidate division Zixibacteria bacterium]
MGWKGPLQQIDSCRWEISQSYRSPAMEKAGVSMQAPGMIYAGAKMIPAITRDDSPEQVVNVATLPGIVGYSMAMPDIHHGYGFPIGGVAAFDARTGIISPGGVGYDINCGVRLIRSDLSLSDIRSRIAALTDKLFENIPTGVGSTGRLRLSPAQVDEVLASGARWAVEHGYGLPEDLTVTEESGSFSGADPELVSAAAKKRGGPQLGTLGAGNHFIEVQTVDRIYEPEAARVFGLSHEGQVLVMIHTGSRGCGHQICTDYLELMRRASKKYHMPLVDRELTSAPADSDEARQYFTAMKCGANFAWANRQVITHWVRESFEAVFGDQAENLCLRQVYDIAHNIAKLETHIYEGVERQVYVHRKGATRAFGPGHKDIPEPYRTIGQPVIIPGDMGSASYLLAGTETAMKETFGSTCHGAGRAMSRQAAIKRLPHGQVAAEIRDKGIYLRAKNQRLISEEAPEAYKDIDEVVEVACRSGIARRVARMRPLGVIKG